MRRADIEVPNRAVDVNSWARSACYPRSSFYPLSHGPSTRNRGITLPWFPTCSTCRSRSQAPLYQCAPRAISIRPEGTFGRLRYCLGGRPPQSNCPPGTVSEPVSRSGLDQAQTKSGISPLAPPSPQTGVHSLPPILRIASTESMPSCSKASRGLFVLLRVTRIFTGTSISPSPSLRQRPSRYAFHAGRNLPDKGFRYLRTVIVTAAVHRGFGSRLSPLPLTFRHWARVSPYTSSFDLAETCVFVKQSPGPIICGSAVLQEQVPSHGGAPLLPKLRGNFAEFLNEGSLVHLI